MIIRLSTRHTHFNRLNYSFLANQTPTWPRAFFFMNSTKLSTQFYENCYCAQISTRFIWIFLIKKKLSKSNGTKLKTFCFLFDKLNHTKIFPLYYSWLWLCVGLCLSAHEMREKMNIARPCGMVCFVMYLYVFCQFV